MGEANPSLDRVIEDHFAGYHEDWLEHPAEEHTLLAFEKGGFDEEE